MKSVAKRMIENGYPIVGVLGAKSHGQSNANSTLSQFHLSVQATLNFLKTRVNHASNDKKNQWNTESLQTKP